MSISNSISKSKPSPALFLAVVAAATLAVTFDTPPALAQGGVGAGPVLEEVTVTARRRDENLQAVPLAVTAYTAESLTLSGTNNIAELAQSAPSVTLEPSRATNTTLTAFIRGVGQQDPLAGFEQGVALYIDDVYIARPQGALLDIYDVERVEVLRGPQGTLYGRNAVGGAIKYVTARLSDERAMSLKASVGTAEQLDLVGTISLPARDNFRLGATLASFQREGFGRSLSTGQDQYDKDITAYRVSAEWDLADNLLLRLAHDNTNDQSSPVAGHRPYPGVTNMEPVLGKVRDTYAAAATLPSTEGIDGNNKVNADGLHLSVDWDIDDTFTLRYIGAQRESDTESVIDFDGLESNDFDAPVIYRNEQTSHELQLLFSAERLNAVVGLYYLDAEAANDFDVVLGQLGVTAYTGGTVDTEAWSIFADVTYDINERWSVSLGGRYTEDERDADIFRANYLGVGSPFFGRRGVTPFAVTSDYEGNETYDNFSPRINVSYRLNDDAQIYGSFSQGWKAGSFDPRGASVAGVNENPDIEQGFDEETLDSYEFGLKADWMGGRLRTNMALFYSQYDDMQVPSSLGIDTDDDGVNDDFVGLVSNAGRAEIRGLEFEGSLAVTDELSLQFNLSRLDSKIKEWILDDVNIASDREVQNTPDIMSYLAANYTAPLGSGTLNVNVNWSHKGDTTQFEVPAPELDQEAYNTFNASFVWTNGAGNWQFGLHGKNLGDEDVRTAGYCFGSTCPTTLGMENNTTVFYAPPRTFTATAEYKF